MSKLKDLWQTVTRFVSGKPDKPKDEEPKIEQQQFWSQQIKETGIEAPKTSNSFFENLKDDSFLKKAAENPVISYLIPGMSQIETTAKQVEKAKSARDSARDFVSKWVIKPIALWAVEKRIKDLAVENSYNSKKDKLDFLDISEWNFLSDNFAPVFKTKRVKQTEDIQNRLWWYTWSKTEDEMSLREVAKYYWQQLIDLDEMYKSGKYDQPKVKEYVDDIKTKLWNRFQNEFKDSKYFPKDFDYKNNYYKVFDMIDYIEDYEINMDTLQKTKPYQKLSDDVTKYQQEQMEQQKRDISIFSKKVYEDLEWWYSEKLWSTVLSRQNEKMPLKYEWKEITFNHIIKAASVVKELMLKETARYDIVFKNFMDDLKTAEWTAGYDEVFRLMESAQKTFNRWMELQKDYYNYFVENIWKPGFTTEKEIRKKWEETRWISADKMYRSETFDWTIRDEIWLLKDISTAVAIWMDLTSLKSEKKLISWEIGVNERVQKRWADAWKFAMNAVWLAFSPVGITFRKVYDDVLNSDPYWSSWRRHYKTELKEIPNTEPSIKKSLAVLNNQVWYIVPWIIEFWLWNKSVAWVKTMWQVRMINQYSDDVVKWYRSVANTIANNRSIWSFKKAMDQAYKLNKTQNFQKAANKAFGMKLFEQSFMIPAYFDAARLDDYTDSDMALDLMFGMTLDVMDAYRHVKNLTKFSNTQTANLLLNSEQFVDQLSKNMFHHMDTWKNFEWRDALTEAQKNILRSKSKWYMDFMLDNLTRMKNELPTKSYGTIIKTMEELTENFPELLPAMEKSWDSLYKLGFEALEKNKKMLQQKIFEQRLLKQVTEEQISEKGFSILDDWTVIYRWRKNDKFYINRWYQQVDTKSTVYDYFINNLIPSKDYKLVDSITSITIWWDTYNVKATSWKDLPKWAKINPLIATDADGKKIDWLAIYRTSNWNVNLSFQDTDVINSIFKKSIDVDYGKKISLDWEIAVTFKWKDVKQSEAIQNMYTYDLDLSVIKNLWEDSMAKFKIDIDSAIKELDDVKSLLKKIWNNLWKKEEVKEYSRLIKESEKWFTEKTKKIVDIQNEIIEKSVIRITLTNSGLNDINKKYIRVWWDYYKLDYSGFSFKELTKKEIVRDLWYIEFDWKKMFVNQDAEWNIVLSVMWENIKKYDAWFVDQLKKWISFHQSEGELISDTMYSVELLRNPLKIKKIDYDNLFRDLNIQEKNMEKVRQNLEKRLSDYEFNKKWKLVKNLAKLEDDILELKRKHMSALADESVLWARLKDIIKTLNSLNPNAAASEKLRWIFVDKIKQYLPRIGLDESDKIIKDLDDVSVLVFKYNDDAITLRKSIKWLDIDWRLKNFFTDIMDGKEYRRTWEKTSKSAATSYDRTIEEVYKLVTDSKNFPEYANIFKSLNSKQFEKAVDLFVSWNWKTMDGFVNKLSQQWIKIKWVSNKLLESFFDSVINTPTKRWNLFNLHNQKVIKSIETKTAVDINTEAMKKVFKKKIKSIKEYEADAVFNNKRDHFLSLKNNEERAVFLNSKWNEEFRKGYARYMRWLDDLNFMIDSSFWKISYSDFLKEKRAGEEGLAYYAMQRKLSELWKAIDMPQSYFDKEPFDRLSYILGKLYNLWSEVTEDDVLWVKATQNILWDMLPPDAKKFINDMSKGINKNVTMEEWLLNKMKKWLKSVDADAEIKEIEELIDLWKKTLDVVDWETKNVNKYLGGYSTRLWRKLFPQVKDYIGDWYFKDADVFRNIINKHIILSNWKSLKDQLLNWNVLQKNFLRSLKKADEFIEDLVKYAHDGTIDQIKATPEYVELLKSSLNNINNIYDDVAKELGPKYGNEFVENIMKMKSEVSQTNISRVADMLEHWDWMEFIRYADFHLFEKLSINHNLADNIRWAPILDLNRIWKWADYSEAYNRKRIRATNILAHNTVTANQAKTMWWFMNDVYVQQAKKAIDWLSNTTVWKTMIWSIRLPLYVASQTFLKPTQAVMLLLMNAQATAVDIMFDSRRILSTNDLYSIRKKYNILIEPGEIEQANRWPLRRMLDWEEVTLKDFFKEKLDRVSETAVAASKLWLYNIWEISFDPLFRNSSLRKAIIDETWILTIKEFDSMLSKLNDVDRDSILQRIRRRAEDQYILRTANSIFSTEWKFIYWDPYSLTWNIKKTLWWAYHFLSAWWNQHVKNYFRLVSNWSQNLEKMYWELLAQVWKYQADILIKDFVSKNADINVFATKMLAAISIWDKMNRNDQKSSRDPRYWRDYMDIIWLWTSFFAPAQWLMSSAVWRQIMNTLKWALLDMWYEHIDVHNWLNAFMTMIETMMSNMWRRMLATNSFVWAMWQRAVKKEAGDLSDADRLILKYIENSTDFLKDFVGNFHSYTEWYTYFLSDDVVNRWYKAKLPTSSTADLDLIFPDLAYFKTEFWNLNTLDRVAALEKEIKDKWPEAIWNWMIYKWPVAKWYNVWKIKWKSNAWDIVYNDWMKTPFASEMNQGRLPQSMRDAEFDNAVFSHLIRWNLLQNYKPVELQDWTILSKWTESMRKLYLNKRWDTIREQQNQENVFFRYMWEMLEEWKYETYVKEFNRTDNDWIKAWIRFLGMIESNLWDDVPWVSYSLIWALSNDYYWWEYNKLRKEAWYKYNEEPEEIREKISEIARAKVVDAFGETLYVTNVPYRWDLSRYVAMRAMPEHAAKFTNSEITKDSVDEEGNNVYYKKTYYWTKLAYESNWWKDNISTWLWNAEMYNTIAINKWVFNVPDIYNWMNMILYPKNEVHAKDPEIQEHKIWIALTIADMYNDAPIPEQSKINWRVWIAMALEPIFSAVLRNEELKAALWKENIDKVANFFWGTVDAIWDFEKSQLEAEWVRVLFKKMQNEKWEWPKDKPTWTLMDAYDKDWNYYSTSNSYWSSENYNYNKPYRDKFRNTIQWLAYPRKYSGYSWSSWNYYNKTLSSYLYYKYYFKDAKSKWVTFGWQGDKIWRMFTTKRTALKVPKRRD